MSVIRNPRTNRLGPIPSVARNPLVIGAPRSGFSLLINVINSLLRLEPKRWASDYRKRVLSRLVDVTSFYMTRKYRQTFARFGIDRDLVFNGEFHLIVGGPKWLDTSDPNRACFRKYFGVRGMGDFLLVTSHPRQILEYHAVLHSHTSPALWLREPYYGACPKFTSVRNPIGIINSACFSLNAMASEYIQKFMPSESEDFIRLRHGLYKLTDLEFVRGMVRFLKTYLDEFLPVRHRYFSMNWEDLIQRPLDTIQKIAAELEISCDAKAAEAIWKPMDHVNLPQFHKHNYRRGKGIVGDWKNSLVNEHMELFRQYGFDEYVKELGYPPIPILDPGEYSPFQKLAARYIQRGEIFRNTGDPVLFGFAFNKSNIDARHFNFKSFPKREWTHVERSTFSNDNVVSAVSDVAEEGCKKLNTLYNTVLKTVPNGSATEYPLLKFLRQECLALMAEIEDAEGIWLCDQAFNSFENA